ncbi:CBS domain-containing protein [Streptomyces nigra]|uniref:CBS domain-containing protein n=1 Tax=Streptomyces nigra TaxID=1827580 RepID=UPI0036875774
MIALETFTVRELAVVSGVGAKTVQTVVKRERERHRVEEVARVPATGRGNRAKVYRVVPTERHNVEKDLRELEQTRQLLRAATTPERLDEGEQEAVPGAFLAAEHVLLHQLPGETDPARREHLIQLAELSIIDGLDGGAVSPAGPAGAVAQAHAAAARFLLHLAEAEQEMAEGPAGQWARLDGLRQTFEAVVGQVAADGEKTLERALRERFQESLRRYGAPHDAPTPPDTTQGLKAEDIMQRGDLWVDESGPVVVAARLMRDLGVGALAVRNAAGVLTGLITDRDIVVHACAAGLDASEVLVGDVVQRTRSVAADTSVNDILSLMRTHQITRLPVLDGAGHPVGMITENEIVRLGGDALNDFFESLRPEKQPPWVRDDVFA